MTLHGPTTRSAVPHDQQCQRWLTNQAWGFEWRYLLHPQMGLISRRPQHVVWMGDVKSTGLHIILPFLDPRSQVCLLKTCIVFSSGHFTVVLLTVWGVSPLKAFFLFSVSAFPLSLFSFDWTAPTLPFIPTASTSRGKQRCNNTPTPHPALVTMFLILHTYMSRNGGKETGGESAGEVLYACTAKKERTIYLILAIFLNDGN